MLPSKRPPTGNTPNPSKRPTLLTSNQPVSQTPSYYRQVLNNHIVKKAPANFSQTTVDTWPDVNLGTPQGDIVDDIAKKFLNTQKSGISNVYKVTGNASDMYGTDSSSGVPKTYLNLHNRIQPTIIGHELIHANDHQTDNLNANVWRHLETLYNNVGIPNFTNSVEKIQNKIDPSTDFKDLYPIDRNEVVDHINKWEKYVSQPKILKSQRFTPLSPIQDWTSTFPKIQQVLATQSHDKPFLLGYGSEFPAHMSERLHEHWNMGQHLHDGSPNPNPLDPNERNFVDSVLGDMEIAYPAAQYPNINNHIRARRASVNYKKGGHIKNYAGGGYVSGGNGYDPYLNTYNYAPPLRLSEYMDDQTPDFQYDAGSYDDPYMSYGNAYDNDGQQYSFKEGGSVKEEDLPRLADLIKRYGRNGDTELAHINPIEAHILKSLGGSGTINPDTGLPEYFLRGVRNFIKNPGKTINKSFRNPRAIMRTAADAAATAAAVFGGPVGGAIGGGLRAVVRKENPLIGALKGAGYGTAAPMAANLAGQGLSALGANGLGSSLQNYASSNMGSWFGNMAQAGQGVRGLGLPFTGGNSGSSSLNLFDTGGSNWFNNSSPLTSTILGGGRGQSPGLGVSAGDSVDNRGFFDKLGDNFSDYLSKPSNLLTLGTTAAQYLGREKPKSPEQIGNEERRRRNASRKTIAEVEAEEALEIARKDLKKKHKNKQLEEDIKNMGSVKRRVVSPEEFARTGRWLEYTDEEGRPVRMKGGGSINRSEVINKGKQLTDDIIAKNLSQNNGKLDEKSLLREFSNLAQALGLNTAEKNALERYSEDLFKNLQFTDDPGYFYRQTHDIPRMKHGGSTHSPYAYLTEEIYSPLSPIGYLSGDSGGQDDLIDAKLSDGEYVFDASTVSDLGDGNNAAGARKLDNFRRNIREHKRGGKITLPPRAKSLQSYLMG